MAFSNAAAAQTLPSNEDDFAVLDGLHPLLAEYVRGIDSCLRSLSQRDVPLAVEKLLEPVVSCADILRPDQMEGADDSYRRHILFADPEGRFTVLALVWQPGQETCIHGHNAWGAVGVHRGEITCELFDLDANEELCQMRSLKALAGAVSSVHPNPEGIHRLANRSDGGVITIHTYGMDLTEHPAGINVVYAD